MYKKHINIWLDITLCLKYSWWLIEKCRLNFLRRPAICYRCSDVNLYSLFYDNGAQRNLKITYKSKLLHYREYFTISLVAKYAAKQQRRLIYVQILRKRKKIILFSCH